MNEPPTAMPPADPAITDRAQVPVAHDRTDAPTAEEEIGHRLADELDQMAVPEDRPAAARDLIHEMMQAGAEGEITADLLREELPPEEYSEADYEAYEAANDEQRADEQ